MGGVRYIPNIFRNHDIHHNHRLEGVIARNVYSLATNV